MRRALHQVCLPSSKTVLSPRHVCYACCSAATEQSESAAADTGAAKTLTSRLGNFLGLGPAELPEPEPQGGTDDDEGALIESYSHSHIGSNHGAVQTQTVPRRRRMRVPHQRRRLLRAPKQHTQLFKSASSALRCLTSVWLAENQPSVSGCDPYVYPEQARGKCSVHVSNNFQRMDFPPFSVLLAAVHTVHRFNCTRVDANKRYNI